MMRCTPNSDEASRAEARGTRRRDNNDKRKMARDIITVHFSSCSWNMNLYTNVPGYTQCFVSMACMGHRILNLVCPT